MANLSAADGEGLLLLLQLLVLATTSAVDAAAAAAATAATADRGSAPLASNAFANDATATATDVAGTADI